MGTNVPTWMEIELGLGDTRLPIRIAVRTDGLALIEVGHEDVQVFDTMCDAEQLGELIDLLTIARDSAAQSSESFHGRE
jgi:hypothetical protein